MYVLLFYVSLQNTSQDSELTVIFHIRFSNEVTHDHSSIFDISCLQNHYYEQQVCGLVFWTNRQGCVVKMDLNNHLVCGQL